ncbi:MAG: homoserine O-acetyltransferase [Acidimicrobiia bacterium]|nr:MAG: homoserine O-acetyltransferase [Acidimicrobiia bacterium]
MKHRVTIDGVFHPEGGGTLRDVEVEIRTWGKHKPNAMLICHALTGNADADDWWHGLFGPGHVFDPATSFIVATNVLGGTSGTTGPTSIDSETGLAYRSEFPRITIRDMVHIQRSALEQLGVQHLDLVIGGSMGGMQALEWAALYPERVGAIIPIGVGAAQSAWAIAISEAQRHAIVSDPAFNGGLYDPGVGPFTGLETARMIAMCSYRSPQNFTSRFGRGADGEHFDVQTYLRYQAEKLVSRFDANTYITLIDAMDSHDLGRGRGPSEAIAHRITTRALVVGIRSDVLYPVAEVRSLAATLPNARFAVLDSPNGHDAFLIDTDQLNDLITGFLTEARAKPLTDGKGASWA